MSSVIHSEDSALIRLFSALANPLRASIVHRLISGPSDVTELVSLLESSQPLISHHLRLLSEAHLIEGIRQGRRVEYRLVDDHVAHIFLDAYHHTLENNHDRDH